MGYQKVAMTRDIPVEGGRQVQLGKDQIAIFRRGGDEAQYFALNDICPHRGAPLSEGYLESDKVLCPWHCFDFNLRTGESTISPHLCVATYQVRVDENEAIWILYPENQPDDRPDDRPDTGRGGVTDSKEGAGASDDL